jgi:hypothetical protein
MRAETISVCLSVQGANVAPGYDPEEFAGDFRRQFAKRFNRAGVEVRLWAEEPTSGFSVKLRVVRILPENVLIHLALSWLGFIGSWLGIRLGAGATFEVEGGLYDEATMIAPIHETGTSFSPILGTSEQGMAKAAENAGDSVARLVESALNPR